MNLALHQFRRRFPSTLCLLIAVFIITALANSCGTPNPTSLTIESIGTSFASGAAPDKTDRTLAFFAGSNNDNFTINLRPGGTGGTNRIIALAGDGSTVTTITSDAATSVTFPGNVGFLRMLSDTLGPTVAMSIDSVTLNSDGNLGNSPQPNNAPTLANKVWSMPLAPNSPLELFFAASGGPAYFVTVSGLAGRTVDVVLDGPGGIGGIGQTGVVTLNTSPGSWAIGADSAEDALTSADRGFVTKTMPGNLDTLFLGVSSSGFAGHGILSVNLNSRLLTVQVRFWSPTPATPAQIAAITTALTIANGDLYRATGGRVRIGTVRLFTTNNPAAGVSMGDPGVDDILLVPTPASVPGGFVADLPEGKKAIQMSAPPAAPFNPGEVAQALLQSNFGLPLERDVDGAMLCPNSLMSNPSMFQPELCWRSNHNPFASNGLGAISPTSMWERFGPQVGAAQMTTSPPRIFRNVTSVTVPLTILTNPS